VNITQVKVFPVAEEKLKAYVSIVIDDCFLVSDLKVIHGPNGLFISMPSKRKKNGEFKDVAHPLNNETRRMIEDKVLGEYERILNERGERMPQAASAVLEDRGDGDSALSSGNVGIAAQPAASEKTLEEIEEMHLRDSFWSVT